MPADPRSPVRDRLGGGGPHTRSAGGTRRSVVRATPTRSSIARLTAGGPAGNERLTTVTGIVLLVLLAVIGVTILRLRSLLWVHLFVGMLLIGPIALKTASTGYRFVRYYTANPRYRRKGPPPAPLRMLAPIVVISTVAVFASGVLLLVIGPSSRDALLPIHKLSFIVWIAATSLHVLGHLPELATVLGLGGETASKLDVIAALDPSTGDHSTWAPAAALAASAGHTSTGHAPTGRAPAGHAPTEHAPTEHAPAGRAGRGLSLAGALAGGTALALATIPQFSPWLDASRSFHHH